MPLVAEGLPISFLSDYGDEDEFAGVCRAVIRQIAPDAPLIDLTHGIGAAGNPPRRPRTGQRAALLPAGVHLAVVDPGVGTERRPVAVTTMEEGRFLVGPDNGLLAPAIERFGGAARAIDISRSPFRLEPVSATFHGRDLFAPVAAHIALGARLDEAGEKFEPSELTGLELPEPPRPPTARSSPTPSTPTASATSASTRPASRPRRAPAARRAHRAAGPRRHLRGRLDGDLRRRPPRATSSSTRTPRERLALAVNSGSAEGLLDLRPDSEVELRPG